MLNQTRNRKLKCQTDSELKLIKTVQPEFTKKKCFGQTMKPLHELKRTSKFKLKKTGGLGIKALVTSMTKHKKRLC